MLPTIIGDVKENVRRALAALEDATKATVGPLRDDLMTIHDTFSQWALGYFETQMLIATRSHDGALPDARGAFRAAEQVDNLLRDVGGAVEIIEPNLRSAALNLKRACELLQTDEAMS